jgi:hypothetical protein
MPLSQFDAHPSIAVSLFQTALHFHICALHTAVTVLCAGSKDNMKTKSLCCGHRIVNPFYQLWAALLQCCMSVVQLLKCSILSILIQAYNMVTNPEYEKI